MVKIMVYYIAKNKDMSDTLCEEFKALRLGLGDKTGFINLFSKLIKRGAKTRFTRSPKILYQRIFKGFQKSTMQNRSLP